MAGTTNSPEGSEAAEIPDHPLVAKLHRDPAATDAPTVLVGFLGPSTRPDHRRLYSDLSFSRYYELPSDAIVAAWQQDADDENGPTLVHVAEGTELDAVSVQTERVAARLLTGRITNGYLATAAAAVPQPQAPQAACCGTLWTAGCTFASNAAAQAPQAACCGTLWTAGCTFASNAAAG